MQECNCFLKKEIITDKVRLSIFNRGNHVIFVIHNGFAIMLVSICAFASSWLIFMPFLGTNSYENSAKSFVFRQLMQIGCY